MIAALLGLGVHALGQGLTSLAMAARRSRSSRW